MNKGRCITTEKETQGKTKGYVLNRADIESEVGSKVLCNINEAAMSKKRR